MRDREQSLELFRILPLKTDRSSAPPPIEDRAGLRVEPVETVFLVKAPFTRNSATRHNVLQIVQRALKIQHRKYFLFLKTAPPTDRVLSRRDVTPILYNTRQTAFLDKQFDPLALIAVDLTCSCLGDRL
jgi:hypothetical protein